MTNKTTLSLQTEVTGRVSGHRDGHGFVSFEDGTSDLYLPPNEMRAVLHGDVVKARVVRHDRKGRPEGRVVEIVERPAQRIIGRLLKESSVWLVAPEDNRYAQDIMIPNNGVDNATEGQVVVVELTEAPSLFAQPMGRVVEVLGEIDDPGMEIEIAVRKYDVPHTYSDACLKASKKLPTKVRVSDRKGRVDLRDIPLMTIDGEDARDFDDAVYCTPTEIKVGRKKQQGWRLLVAIADVSHYVKTEDAIDIDAYERATSVYFPRRVIPMLPEKLSNGLCSLKPQVDRLCMVCDMTITAEGKVNGYQFYPAVMHSHARMTYTQVAAILTNTRGPEAKKFAARVPDIINLHAVYQLLVADRKTRGALEFETVETKIICDESGRIERIEPTKRNDAHKLIEEAMLVANTCSADFINRSKHTALFRVHDEPTLEKLNILREFLRNMGVHQTIPEEPKPSDLQAIAEAVKDRTDALQIHTMLLRSMSQAIYSPHNMGHFGLAYEQYTHFTSPIRRYPDLLVHRVIKAILNGEKYQLPALPTPGEAHKKFQERLEKRKSQHAASSPESKKRNASKAVQAWEAAGLHCSACERRADEASRDVESWLKCMYMREHLGEEYTGKVTGVTSFGLFVTLDQLYVEGLVHISDLGGDYFRYDEARQELRGERLGTRYTIGTPLVIQVSRVDLDARKIDFHPVNEAEEAFNNSKGGGRSNGNTLKISKKSTRRKKAADDADEASSSKRSTGKKSSRKSNAKTSRTTGKTSGKTIGKSSKKTTRSKRSKR